MAESEDHQPDSDEHNSNSDEMAEFGGLEPSVDDPDSTNEEVSLPVPVHCQFPTADVRRNPLTEAIQTNNLPLLKELIEKGTDVNSYSDLSYNSGSLTMRETPIVTAARCGNLEATKLLVGKGCNINEKTGVEDSTPIQISSNKGHLEVVKFLIEVGADVNYPGYLGFTPILEAVMENHLPVVKLLTENGAIINCRTSSEYSYDSLLMMAVVMEQDVIAEYLLKAGADVNMMNNMSTIPLAVALTEKKEHLSNLLISAGSKLKEQHLQAPHINSTKCQEHIVKARMHPLSLLEICRIVIRQNFICVCRGESILESIEGTLLPTFLKQYLAFEM